MRIPVSEFSSFWFIFGSVADRRFCFSMQIYRFYSKKRRLYAEIRPFSWISPLHSTDFGGLHGCGARLCFQAGPPRSRYGQSAAEFAPAGRTPVFRREATLSDNRTCPCLPSRCACAGFCSGYMHGRFMNRGSSAPPALQPFDRTAGNERRCKPQLDGLRGIAVYAAQENLHRLRPDFGTGLADAGNGGVEIIEVFVVVE